MGNAGRKEGGTGSGGQTAGILKFSVCVCVCMCVCTHARMCECVCVCVCVCVYVCVCACACVCVHACVWFDMHFSCRLSVWFCQLNFVG